MSGGPEWEGEKGSGEDGEGKEEIGGAFGMPSGGGRATGVIGPSGRPLLRCDWCRSLWDPGLEKDCDICKRFPPAKKGKKVGQPRVAHGNHSMCFTCFNVYAKARKRIRLEDTDLKHLARASSLRKKLVGESLLPQRNSDGEGDRPSA